MKRIVAPCFSDDSMTRGDPSFLGRGNRMRVRLIVGQGERGERSLNGVLDNFLVGPRMGLRTDQVSETRRHAKSSKAIMVAVRTLRLLLVNFREFVER